jgi:hypothetical protein
MFRGHHRHDPLLETHQGLEVGEKRGPKDHDEIDLIGRERGHGLLVVEHPDLEAHHRMARAERGNLSR